MEKELTNERSPRRNFLSKLTGGAALFGLATLGAPLRLAAEPEADEERSPAPGKKSEVDVWLSKINGTHRVVYDATRPHEVMPFAWPRVFLMTNEQTGTPASHCAVVLVLRHEAICYAFQDAMWAKYNFAEVFKATDHGGAFQ